MKKELINVLARLFALMPPSVKRVSYSIRLFPVYVGWRVNPDGYRHALDILSPLQAKYKGCRCIVIGNGPSLRQMDLQTLKDEYTFGLNRIYLLFEELGFQTTFLVSVNRFVLEQFALDLRGLSCLKFFNWLYHYDFQVDEKTVFLAPKTIFRADGQVTNGIYPISGTVTNVALEIAFFMGFSEVILIGVDHNFVEKGTGNLAVVSQGADLNHFSPNYFGPGTVWQLPDIAAMEHGFRLMKSLFEHNGRNVVDATMGGNLQIFPKVSFYDYLSASRYTSKRDFLG